ncbi:MAG: hypothetical protein ABR497_00255 [Kiritimatiellia bacterium]|nr:hypothetical protein [Lentisphaerota bacterium]
MKQTTPIDLERQSSAVTLSDMEIFVFPELLYSLLLANLMSPRIWLWRQDPWFKNIDKMKPYRRIQRLKQYIMDHYAFNLDLNTWGLTTQARELARFRNFIDAEALQKSNALFGYEGDRYYFDIDIRTHFGLDQYDGECIPYWKTETVEAMDAFRYRDGFQTGAGECVSLSVLYAAALFIICRIPLQDIFMLATPLHSQNFIDLDDGILTNNRRLVTKTMWFNGTALSAQARRALENEQVTIVAHESGHIHVFYDQATIQPAAYARFCKRLRHFLRTELNTEILGNFLRHSREFQKCFQIRWPIHGHDHHARLDRVFDYEQDSPARLTDASRPRLMADIDTEEFQLQPLPGCIMFNDLEEFIRQHRLDFSLATDMDKLRRRFSSDCLNAAIAIENLIKFCHVQPRLPDLAAKTAVDAGPALELHPEMERDDLVERLTRLAPHHAAAALALHAYRNLNLVPDQPFLKAAMERNPVSLTATAEMPLAELFKRLEAMPDISIYDGPGRLAQPDEVWNFQRGDGVEKALLLAHCLRHRQPSASLEINIAPDRADLNSPAGTWRFQSTKQLSPRCWTWPGA